MLKRALIRLSARKIERLGDKKYRGATSPVFLLESRNCGYWTITLAPSLVRL